MMTFKRLTACGLVAVALLYTFEFGRASGPRPGSAIQTERASLAAANSLAQAARGRRRRRKPATPPLPVVREIDAEGLKKILQRDAGAPRPLLINFWATWCTPCREEFPDLVRIDKDYRARNLDFVIISLDDPAEIRTSVPRFLQRMRAQMPAYLLNAQEPDVAINAVDPEWAGGMPATFLLDSSGEVVYKHLGPINPQELRAELEKVMGGK